MATLSQIKNNTKWNESATTLNENFNKINVELKKLSSMTVNNLGYYKSESDLPLNVMDNSVAYINETLNPPFSIWVFKNGKWQDSGFTYTQQIQLGDYYTRTECDEKNAEIHRQITGDSATNSNGFEYPFVFLGNFADYTGLIAELDKLHSKDNSSQTIGEFRALMNGNMLFIRNYVRSWADEEFIQYIEGTVKLNDDGALTVSAEVGIFMRKFSGGKWAVWEIANDSDLNLVYDETPTLGSENLVNSGNIRKALDLQKQEVDHKLESQLPAIEDAKNEAIEAIENSEQSAISNFNAQKVTPEMLSESTKQLIETAGGGTINNLPDDEDLRSVEVGTGVKVLKFADRQYNKANFSGKGYKILRKNDVYEKNVLTQDMVNEANTVYEIRYDFDLNGAEITLPDNCILKFEGGSLSNGTLIGKNTGVVAPIEHIFSELTIEGDFSIENVYSEWFGAKPFINNASYVGGDVISINSELDDYEESSDAINKALALSSLSNGIVRLQSKMYKTEGTINLLSNQHLYIPRNCTIVPYMTGNAKKKVVVNKEDSSGTTVELDSEPEVMAENEYIPTSEMGVCISMKSIKTKITGEGTICLSKSKYTIGIDLFGVAYNYMDMAFTPIIDVSTIGAGKCATWAPDTRDTIGDVAPTEDQGEDGDYYYDRSTCAYYRKESGAWKKKSPSYNQANLFNVSLRLEANGSDNRIINPYITIFDMYGWRGMEVITSGTGWINESILKGTISNKHGSFISVFAHGGGVSIHDWSKIVMQVGGDMQHDCRMFFASKCNIITVGNIWDLAWLTPIRVSTAFELCKRTGNVNLTATDGDKYVLDNGSNNKYNNKPYFSPSCILSKTYDNVLAYRSPVNAGGFSSDYQRSYNQLTSLSVLASDTAKDYSGKVSKYFFDGENYTFERVIDIDNNLFAYAFNLNVGNKSNVEMLNNKNVIYIEVDYFPSLNADDNKCFLVISIGRNILQKVSLKSNNKTNSSGANQYIQKAFLSFTHNARLDDLRIIFYAEEVVAGTTIDIYSFKIWKDGTYHQAWPRPRFGGETKQMPDALPCGAMWYDKTKDTLLINKGDAQNPSLSAVGRTTIVESSDSELVMSTGILYKYGIITNLSVSFDSPADGVCNEYMLQFETGTEGAESIDVSFPSDVKWRNNDIPEWQNNQIYQISIVDNLAIYANFPK